MSSIETYFKERKSKALFIPYFSMGDPSYADSIEWGKSIIEGGADILEIGIPFTDPVADGPVIQKSYKRALDNNPFSMDQIFYSTSEIHKFNQNIPIVYLCYLNPIIHFGLKKFLKKAFDSGVRGMVIPDIPFDSREYGEIRKIALSNGIDIINLITPATEEARIKQISKESSGFIYYVTSFGVTGERKNLNGKDLEKRIKNLRKWIKIPISAGFGISTPDQAGQISKYSDGIIIGSAIQKIIEENLSNRDNCKKSLKLFVAKVKSKVS